MNMKVAKYPARWLAGMFTCATLLACASRSVAPDIERVSALTNSELVIEATKEDPDPVTHEDVKTWLAEPITGETAVRIAILNNRELRATLREIGMVRGDLITAGLLPNPQVEIEILPERNTQFEARVEINLTQTILAPMRAHAVNPQLQAATYDAAASTLKLSYDVRSAFLRVQAAEQSLALANKSLDALAARRDAALAMEKAGNITALALAHEQAAYEQARVAVASQTLNATLEREAVHRLLGVFGNEVRWDRAGDLPEVPSQANVPPDLEAQSIRASLELAATRERLESLARQSGVLLREGWLPDISVDAHGLVGVPEGQAGSGSTELRLGGGMHLTLPVFDRRQGRRVANEARFDGLVERYYGQAISLRSIAREAQERLAIAHGRARHYHDAILPAFERVMDETILQYNAMQIGVFEVLQARRMQLEQELASVEAAREYWDAAAQVQALLAGVQVRTSHSAASMPINLSAEMSGERGGH